MADRNIKNKRKIDAVAKIAGWVVCISVVLSASAMSLPLFLKYNIEQQEITSASPVAEQFPVTVNPKKKLIIENPAVNDFLESDKSPLRAALGNPFWGAFESVAAAISKLPLYQSIAALNGEFITLTPGMRKEQVIKAFSDALSWSKADEQKFMTPDKNSNLPLPEGSYAPGVYFVSNGTTPAQAQAAINHRFTQDVLMHYGTSTAEIVPLNDALTVASLIERETSGKDDMRLISGIIWNRLFINMNLQLDASLQYVKASKSTSGSWWPAVVPADKFKKSPYNTYLNQGLPPTPIASPSVAAIVAALNPVKTPCLFYFHDKTGTIRCSNTYEEHVKLLQKYYGQGK